MGLDISKLATKRWRKHWKCDNSKLDKCWVHFPPWKTTEDDAGRDGRGGLDGGDQEYLQKRLKGFETSTY